MGMNEPYLCPACRENRRRFQLIYKLAREVHKHPESGRIEFAEDQWEVVRRGSGLELEVRCLLCGHSGDERRFIAMARAEATPRPRGRR